MTLRFDRKHFERKLAALRAQREKDAGALADAELRLRAARTETSIRVIDAEHDLEEAEADLSEDEVTVRAQAQDVKDAEEAVGRARDALSRAQRVLESANAALGSSMRAVDTARAALDAARRVDEAAGTPHRTCLDEATRRLEKTDRRIAGLRATEPRIDCARECPTPGYAPCTRDAHAEGPCAHPLAEPREPKTAMDKALDDEGGMGRLLGATP